MAGSRQGDVQPAVEVYPNAPLRAVAIEARFPALLDAIPRFGVFQRRHISEYDRLYETELDDDDHLTSGDDESEHRRSVMLLNRTRVRALSVARDRLTVITFSYLGFVDFTAWAVPMLLEGLRDLGVENINRLNYRYENRIKRATREIDLGTIFRLSLSPPPGAQSATRHVHLYWHQLWSEGTVEVAIDGCSDMSADELRFNITAHHKVREQGLDGIERLAAETHRRARLTFEELITPNFREELRGRSST